MRDIVTRLAHVHPECTCDAWFGEPHDELCLLSVVRDAEKEILRLQTESASLIKANKSPGSYYND